MSPATLLRFAMVVSGAKLVWFVDVEIPETSARAAIGIAATPGAILAVASTIILLGFGLVMRGCAGHGRAFRILVATLAFLNIVGTALAGYLLDSETLEHDPEKCEAVFRKDHAQTTT